ncbi:hypothetical protein [Streptomyces minutiscleroticus]|uniref:hypothetical protein n=1 Tax=Streptomyces minutiscleroticus TaxID=68238 RepID=UPI00167C4680|nr:hypothetical protein [Streptomyces minutiscleroticus]
MEPDPSAGELLLVFLFVGIIAVPRVALIVLPVIAVGIWLVPRVRRRRSGDR